MKNLVLDVINFIALIFNWNIKCTTFYKLFIAVVFLTFISCSEEIYQKDEHGHMLNKNQISLVQFKSETKIKDFETFFKVPISKNENQNRTVALSEFVIDTVAIQRYVGEYNKITYSFKIYTLISNLQTDVKYNLVYTKENNIWEKSIIAFKEKVSDQVTGNKYENFEKLYDSRMSSSSENVACITENYAFHCTSTGSCAESGQCDMCELCVTKTITVDFCGGSGGTPSDPNGNGPVDPGPASYIPLNPFTFTPNLFDNPVFDNPNYINAIKAHYFFNHLSYAEQVWATENVEVYNQIIEYLISQEWSTQSNSFANEMIVFK